MTGDDAYRFGAFTLIVGERRLIADGESVRLSPKAFDLLTALVQDPGRLMTKHELLARVWPEVFVEDGILTVHVSALRKALGDEARRSYIEMVSGSGYRFVAAVSRDSHQSALPSERCRLAELYELVGWGRMPQAKTQAATGSSR